MDPLLAGLITGGSSLLGSIFSSNTSAANTNANIQMQQQTNEFNAQQAQINRDFQAQQSSTAYQRASQDMKAAGLNPAMMFGSGSAASTPSGATATGQAPRSEKTSPFAGLGDAASKAVSSAVAMKTFDKMTQEIANLKVDAQKTAAQTKTEEQLPALRRAETAGTNARTALTREQRVNEELDRQVHGNAATQALHERELRERYPWIDTTALGADVASKVIKPASDIIMPSVSTAYRAKGLNMLREKMNQTHHSETRFGKGYSATESWSQ